MLWGERGHFSIDREWPMPGCASNDGHRLRGNALVVEERVTRAESVTEISF